MLRSSSLFVIAMVVSGCVGQSTMGGAPGLKVVDQMSLPAPTTGSLAGGGRPYVIGPFDKLVIDVFGIEEMSRREIQADASGRIAFPLVGAITAAGLTPEALAAELEAGLRRQHVRDPQVTVNLQETLSQLVTVDGEVKEPGLYPVVGKMTLMRAVAIAKGAGEFARTTHVVVFRTVDETRYAALYNLKAIRDGQSQDPEIFASDVVIVGDNAARRIFRDALQVLPAVTTPLVYVLTRK